MAGAHLPAPVKLGAKPPDEPLLPFPLCGGEYPIGVGQPRKRREIARSKVEDIKVKVVGCGAGGQRQGKRCQGGGRPAANEPIEQQVALSKSQPTAYWVCASGSSASATSAVLLPGAAWGSATASSGTLGWQRFWPGPAWLRHTRRGERCPRGRDDAHEVALLVLGRDPFGLRWARVAAELKWRHVDTAAVFVAHAGNQGGLDRHYLRRAQPDVCATRLATADLRRAGYADDVGRVPDILNPQRDA